MGVFFSNYKIVIVIFNIVKSDTKSSEQLSVWLQPELLTPKQQRKKKKNVTFTVSRVVVSRVMCHVMFCGRDT
jgi:hypothetical protein